MQTAGEVLANKRKNLWRLKLSFSSVENFYPDENEPKTPPNPIPRDIALKKVGRIDSTEIPEEIPKEEIQTVDEWVECMDDDDDDADIGNQFYFSKQLDPVAKILLTPEEILLGVSFLKFDPFSIDGKKFGCKQCPVKFSRRREQLTHIATEHLKKFATVEMLALGLKMIWEKSELIDGRRRKVFYCNFPSCGLKIEASADRRGTIIRSDITGHMKQNDKIFVENIREVYNKWQSELMKVKILAEKK